MINIDTTKDQTMQLSQSMFYRILLFAGLLYMNNSFGQVANFKEGQVINLGGGERLEVVRYKGEGEQQQCELKYYVNGRKVGKPFWLKSANIAALKKSSSPKSTIAENRSPKNEVAKVTHRIAKKIQIKEKAIVETSVMARKETAAVQADMLAMAKLLAQQPETPKRTKERKEEKPKK